MQCSSAHAVRSAATFAVCRIYKKLSESLISKCDTKHIYVLNMNIKAGLNFVVSRAGRHIKYDFLLVTINE